MTYNELWNIDPALNNSAAPMGAPEGGLAWDRVSDTFRVVMAAVAELREAIKGKTPTAGLADDSLKFAGLNKQQWYDLLWPVGSERGWHSTGSSGLVPSGVTATWTLVATDAFLLGAGTLYPTPGVTVGSNTEAVTGPAGAHGHAATVGATTLTIAQMPLHGHPARLSGAAAGSSDGLGGLMLDDDNLANAVAYSGVPDSDFGQQIGGAGGNGSHTHTLTLADAADHTHDISLPRRYVVAWFRRTA